MRRLVDSDVFSNFLNNGNATTGKITKILNGIGNQNSGIVVLNDELTQYISTMVRFYTKKDPAASSILAKITTAVKDGSILLVKIPPEMSLPRCLPFIKFKKDGKFRVIVDLTYYVREERNADVSHIDYDIDVTPLYALLLPAYLSMSALDDSTVLSNEIMFSSSVLWAKTFTKVLNRVIGLSTNKERYIAFNYFAIRFFLKYYIMTSDVIIDSIANKYLEPYGNNYAIIHMSEQIERLGLNEKLYSSFTDFCNVLFNNEVSNIKGIKVNNIANEINTQFYISQFINQYNFESILSLANFQYFLFVLISVNVNANICSKSLSDIIKEDQKLMARLMTSLYREIK